VAVRNSKLKKTIAEILVREGFLGRVEKNPESEKDELVLFLKYVRISSTKREPAIQDLERVSSEGRRIYVKHHEVEKVKNGYGIAILSTSRGVMTGGEAYRKGLGGEYLCKVW
jgi:small subunit ribosomal protein S8